MENIVRLSELDQFVADTIDKVLGGVTKARALGHQAEVPKSIDFQVTVIKDFQALDIVSAENAQTEEIQGGGSTEMSTSKGSETSLRTESSKSTESRSGNETSESNEKSQVNETSNSNEEQNRSEESSQTEERKQTGKEAGSIADKSQQEETTTANESGTQNGNNAHVENGNDASNSRTETT